MNVVVIYELIPERTQIYVIKDCCPTILDKLKKSHGLFANVSVLTHEQEILLHTWLPEYLHDLKPIYDTNHPENSSIIEMNEPCIIISTGFML